MVTYIEHDVVTNAQAKLANQVKTFAFDALPLQLGGQFGPVTLTYETWGTLNAAADNVVLITHALTGNTHAHDAERPHDTKVAWW
ncbi:MAG: homoserine O-acetyltransferase, partial [Ktedonobacteraceae bacterium]